MQAAAPGEAWTGSAAQAYAGRNERLAGTIGALADLDRRLGAEVDRSAAVVAAGRQDLDSVKRWVLDAAANVPPNAAGERALIPVVARGVGEVADILQRSNGDMSGIAGRIRQVGTGYDALASREGRDGDTRDPDGNWDVGKETKIGPITITDEQMAGLQTAVLAREFDITGTSSESTYDGAPR